ncbi:MAG: 1-(5-phosphoribosyl)-5-[Oscillospiraceae bacterium]|nr:1-(5-phosphoribosyl)-5-[(5-phosphoribosylamino)methylideneamino]imidazole-4-carboxamide isomerase [Oscillospiraceae bacterium]
MYILPAIDLYEGKAVRLYKGDYSRMAVYSDNPPELTGTFRACGAEYLHMVDLEGAKDGSTPNYAIEARIASDSGLKVEIGGGIRSEEVIKRYLDCGVCRVILGTAAVEQPELLEKMVGMYSDKIAVGVDIKDGLVAIKGWTETSSLGCEDFCARLCEIGVRTVICTDISRDGTLGGANRELYRGLNERFPLDLIASGGVSTLEDVAALKEMGMYGATIGKAWYSGAIDLKKAVEVAG